MADDMTIAQVATMIASYRKGQLTGIEAAMTTLCDHCFRGYNAPTATQDIVKDGNWVDYDVTSGYHWVNDRRRKCRAHKLIALLVLVLAEMRRPTSAKG